MKILTPAAFVLLVPLSLSIAVGAGGEEEGISTEDWFPLEERETVYEITEGEDEGERAVERFSPVDGEEDRWRLEMEGRRTTTVQVRPDGELNVMEQVLPKKEMRWVFDPPATMLPPRLVEGQPIRESGKVRVYDTEDGEEEHAGTYTQELELITTNGEVETPAGEQAGYHVRAIQIFDLSLADIRLEMNFVFHPEDGLVYQHMARKTEKVGLFEDDWVEEMRLEEGGDP